MPPHGSAGPDSSSARARRWASSVGALDRGLIARSARIRPTAVDRALLTLSRLANHSVLWASVAAALAILGGRHRRGAVRGMCAVAGASALANGVAKPLFPRRRPPDDSVPFVRRLVAPPVSSSFPSGHAASAAAFVTGVALESRAAGLALAPLAAAVGYSRVHIGVHWPSDVVAGAGLGVAVGLATSHLEPTKASRRPLPTLMTHVPLRLRQLLQS